MNDLNEKIIYIPGLQEAKSSFEVDTTDFDNLLKQEGLSNDTRAIIQAQKYNFVALVNFSKNYEYWMSNYIYPFNKEYSNAINLIYSDHLVKLKDHFESFDEFKTEYEGEILKSEQARKELLDKITSLDSNTEKISGENFNSLDQKIGVIQAQTYTTPEDRQIENNFQLSGYIFIAYIIPLLIFIYLSYKFFDRIFRLIF